MHIYFSGIGGVGLGPLAEIAIDAGHQVSGSDKQQTPMFEQLTKHGATTHIGQEVAVLSQLHAHHPIDWFVYTAALPSDHPELAFAKANGIKTSKRDELLAKLLEEKQLKLIAVSGTHGKTTTTAMVVWLFKQLGIPVSYSIGTSISFGSSGAYDSKSEYFVYECDEFDRNFLHFRPYLSLIVSQSYDHPDTYPTQEEYDEAFRQFIGQSKQVITWKECDTSGIHLGGEHNRSNAATALAAVERISGKSRDRLLEVIDTFPGTSRRFEKLADNLYTDYAHHPEEIAATLQLARELSDHVVAVYQPHQNIRQKTVSYTDCFNDAEKIYWLSTYLSREDPDEPTISPRELTKNLAQENVVYSELNDTLRENITQELADGKLVVLMGAGSIDDWARQTFTS